MVAVVSAEAASLPVKMLHKVHQDLHQVQDSNDPGTGTVPVQYQ